MIKAFYSQFIIFALISFCLSCEVENNNDLDFCLLVDSPKKYDSKIIQTKAIVLGYHKLILYSEKCLEQEKVVALEMSYEDRQKIGDARKANEIDYKTSFLNNNLYAEITVVGELRENIEKNPLSIHHPNYKFVVKEIKAVNILKEEIYPTPKARGVKEINKK